MFHYSLRVIDEPKMSEIRILNLCHKKTILVDIYRQSLLNPCLLQLSCREASEPISDFHVSRPSEVLRYCPSAIREYKESA